LAYQLINSYYFRQTKDFDNKLILVVRNLETGKKGFKVIEEPMIEFFMNKNEYWIDEDQTPVAYIEEEKVNPIKVPYKKLYGEIANRLGGDYQSFFKQCLADRRFNLLQKLHLNPNIHGSDIDIQDYYISKFLKSYPRDPSKEKITKAFFDIEADLTGYNGFPDEHEAPCPVDIITVIFEETMECHTFILRDSSNPLIEEFEGTFENLISERKSFYEKEHNAEIDFFIHFFDDELEMITSFFDMINEVKPDFVGAWNNQFDILTLANRIAKHGYYPEDIMCPQEIPYKLFYFNEDTFNQDPADRGSYAEIASYSNYVDLMLLYANLRKGAGKKESYSLDAVVSEELGEHKDAMEDDITMKNWARKDFAGYVKYNIHDTVLLFLLERQNEDINLLYDISIMTETRVTKALKKTVCLANMARKFFRQQGYIMSNNRNRSWENASIGKFRGAFVADPLLNEPNGILVNGKPSKFIFENVIDVDLASLYPNIILTYNIDRSTQIGKLILEEENENGLEDIGYQFFDSLISRDYPAIAKRWFNLPDSEELIDLFKQEKTNQKG
jgi:DNA polymerase elongation subunit (family B)